MVDKLGCAVDDIHDIGHEKHKPKT
jgi:hypothetical protein